MVKPEPEEKDELKLEEGSAEVTLQDVYVLFYLLVKQNQEQQKKLGKPDTQMAFDLRVFKNLPKNLKVNFVQQDGKLLAWVPEKKKDREKKSSLYLPTHEIIKPN